MPRSPVFREPEDWRTCQHRPSAKAKHVLRNGLLWGLAWGGAITLISVLAGCDPPASEPVGIIGTEQHSLHHVQQRDLLVPESINRYEVLVCTAALDPAAVRAVVHRDAKILQAYSALSVALWSDGAEFWDAYRAAMSNLDFAWTGIPGRSARIDRDGNGDTRGGGAVGSALDPEGRILSDTWNAYFIRGTHQCAEANAIFMATHQDGWDGVYIDMATPGVPTHILKKLAREGAFGSAVYDIHDIDPIALRDLQRETRAAREYLLSRLRELAPGKLILINAWGERHRAWAQSAGIESPFFDDDIITLTDGITFEYPPSAAEPIGLEPNPEAFDSWEYVTRVGRMIRAIRGECYSTIWYRPGWTISDNYGLLLRGGHVIDRANWFGQGLSYPEHTRSVMRGWND